MPKEEYGTFFYLAILNFFIGEELELPSPEKQSLFCTLSLELSLILLNMFKQYFVLGFVT